MELLLPLPALAPEELLLELVEALVRQLEPDLSLVPGALQKQVGLNPVQEDHQDLEPGLNQGLKDLLDRELEPLEVLQNRELELMGVVQH